MEKQIELIQIGVGIVGELTPSGVIDPSGAYPSGIPSGIMQGAVPSGFLERHQITEHYSAVVDPNQSLPSGVHPSGVYPSGIYASGLYPSGNLKYHNVGSYVNRQAKIDDVIKLERVKIEVIDALPGDNCQKKMSWTRFKVGVDDGSNSAWHLGLKDPVTYFQYLLKIGGMYASTDGVEWHLIQVLHPNVSLSDDMELSRCFPHADIQFIPINEGVAVRHRFYSELKDIYSGYKYFGVRWDVNDAAIFDELQPSLYPQTEFYEGEDYFIEYFDKDLFGDKEYLDHYYTNKTTAISTETWTTGTYEVGGALTVDTLLTYDNTGGDIVIKYLGSTNNISTTTGGSHPRIVQTNSAPDRRVIITSVNDNMRGEIIDGTQGGATSTGNPTYDDIQMPVLDGAATGTTTASSIYLDNWEMHYVTVDSTIPAIGINLAARQFETTYSETFYLKNGLVKNCYFNPPTSSICTFIGSYGNNNRSKDATFENIHIGKTNKIGLNAFSGGVNTEYRILTWSAYTDSGAANTAIFRRNHLDMNGTVMAGIYARSYAAGSGFNHIIEHNVIKGHFKVCAIRTDDRLSSGTHSTIIRNNRISNSYTPVNPKSINNNGAGIFSYRGSTDQAIYQWDIYNNIFIDINGYAIFKRNVVTDNRDNNCYWNCYGKVWDDNTGAEISIGANSLEVDPQLSDLGGTFYANPFLNGIEDGNAVGNPLLFTAGNDTYTNWGDTGYVHGTTEITAHAASDNVPIGPLYTYKSAATPVADTDFVELSTDPGVNTVYRSGSYILTANITLGTYDYMSFDGTEGPIVIKKTATTYYFYANSTTGTCAGIRTIDTSKKHPIISTSINDDFRGIVHPTSTGQPSNTDHGTLMVIYGKGSLFWEWFELHYQGGTGSWIIYNELVGDEFNIVFRHGKLRNINNTGSQGIFRDVEHDATGRSEKSLFIMDDIDANHTVHCNIFMRNYFEGTVIIENCLFGFSCYNYPLSCQNNRHFIFRNNICYRPDNPLTATRYAALTLGANTYFDLPAPVPIVEVYGNTFDRFGDDCINIYSSEQTETGSSHVKAYVYNNVFMNYDGSGDYVIWFHTNDEIVGPPYKPATTMDAYHEYNKFYNCPEHVITYGSSLNDISLSASEELLTEDPRMNLYSGTEQNDEVMRQVTPRLALDSSIVGQGIGTPYSNGLTKHTLHPKTKVYLSGINHDYYVDNNAEYNVKFNGVDITPSGHLYNRSFLFEDFATTEYIQCEEKVLDEASALWISWWQKDLATPTTSYLISIGANTPGNVYFHMAASGNYYWWVTKGTSTRVYFPRATYITNGVWHKYDLVWDSTPDGSLEQMFVYIDGNKIPVLTDQAGNSNGPFGIQSSTLYGSLLQTANAEIQDYQLTKDYVPTDEEIASIYNSGKPFFTPITTSRQINSRIPNIPDTIKLWLTGEDITDYSNNGFTITNNNSMPINQTTKRFRGSYYSDGTAGLAGPYLSLPNGSYDLIGQDFTISFWYAGDTPANGSASFSSGGFEWFFYTTSNINMLFSAGTSEGVYDIASGKSVGGIEQGVFHHYCVTRQYNTNTSTYDFVAYRDGEVMDSWSSATDFVSDASAGGANLAKRMSSPYTSAAGWYEEAIIEVGVARPPIKNIPYFYNHSGIIEPYTDPNDETNTLGTSLVLHGEEVEETQHQFVDHGNDEIIIYNDSGNVVRSTQSYFGKHSAYFDGTTDTGLMVGNNGPLFSEETKIKWRFWMNPLDNETLKRIFSIAPNGSDQIQIRVDNNDTLLLLMATENKSITFANAGISYGTWVFIEIQFDGTQATAADKLRLWVNGVEKTSQFGGGFTQTDCGTFTTQPTAIGMYSTSWGSGIGNYYGYLEDFAIELNATGTPETVDEYTERYIPKAETILYLPMSMQKKITDGFENKISGGSKVYHGKYATVVSTTNAPTVLGGNSAYFNESSLDGGFVVGKGPLFSNEEKITWRYWANMSDYTNPVTIHHIFSIGVVSKVGIRIDHGGDFSVEIGTELRAITKANAGWNYDEWNFWEIQFDGSQSTAETKVRLWINGIEKTSSMVATFTQTATPTFTNENTGIGINAESVWGTNNDAYTYKGYLREFAITRHATGTPETEEEYNKPFSITRDTILYVPFNREYKEISVGSDFNKIGFINNGAKLVDMP